MSILKVKLVKLLLKAAVFGFIVIVGGGIYESVNIYPAMLNGPPRSLILFQGNHAISLPTFWIISHSFSEIILIVLLVLLWKRDVETRKVLMKAFLLHMFLRFITLLYFAPAIISIIEIPYAEVVDPEINKRLILWITLSVIRVPASVLVAYWILQSYLIFLLKNNPLSEVRKDYLPPFL